jgi:hypothetical protein
MNLYGCQKIELIRLLEYQLTVLITFKLFATKFGDRKVGDNVLEVESNYTNRLCIVHSFTRLIYSSCITVL